MTTDLAIVGGTGLTKLAGLEITERIIVHTSYGEPSAPVTYGNLCGKRVMFLPRHGYGHTIPPHKINYRANMWALKEAGAKSVVAVAAVGGINKLHTPGDVIIPDQIVDYTWSRIHTYFEEGLTQVTHIDFTEPYSEKLRQLLLSSASSATVKVGSGGVYAVTQGPRLETSAEIDRLERDGCDLVGMTGMPEAALARELGLEYATCAVVANRAAGRGDGAITMTDIEKHLKTGTTTVGTILEKLVKII